MLFSFCKVGKLSGSFLPPSLLLSTTFPVVPIEVAFVSKNTCLNIANGQRAQTHSAVLGSR